MNNTEQDKVKFSKRELDVISAIKQYPELNDEECAEKIGLKRTQFNIIKNRPHVKERLLSEEEKAIQIITDLKVEAAEELGNLLKSEDDGVRLRTAVKILGGVLDGEKVTVKVDLSKISEALDKAIGA